MKPPLNKRTVHARVCAECNEFRLPGDSWYCVRDPEDHDDAGDMTQWSRTCDRWRAPRRREEAR